MDKEEIMNTKNECIKDMLDCGFTIEEILENDINDIVFDEELILNDDFFS